MAAARREQKARSHEGTAGRSAEVAVNGIVWGWGGLHVAAAGFVFRCMGFLLLEHRGENRPEDQQEDRAPPDPGTMMRYIPPVTGTEAPLAGGVVAAAEGG